MPQGLEARTDEPQIPEGTDIRRLDRAVRAELRGLPKELADIVAAHLLLAGELVDEDPDRAFAHAQAARRRAARLPIVREGAAETAYAAGRYDVALAEYRALRRMTGSADYLPVMADCERAVGRPLQALRLVREAVGQPMDPGSAVELRIVEAGARHDLGQTAEAARLLRATLTDVGRRSADATMATPMGRLHYALADVLLDLGRTDEARAEFVRAAELDLDGVTDAAERVDAIDGVRIDLDESDEDEIDEDEIDEDEIEGDEIEGDEIEGDRFGNDETGADEVAGDDDAPAHDRSGDDAPDAGGTAAAAQAGVGENAATDPERDPAGTPDRIDQGKGAQDAD